MSMVGVLPSQCCPANKMGTADPSRCCPCCQRSPAEVRDARHGTGPPRASAGFSPVQAGVTGVVKGVGVAKHRGDKVSVSAESSGAESSLGFRWLWNISVHQPAFRRAASRARADSRCVRVVKLTGFDCSSSAPASLNASIKRSTPVQPCTIP